MYHLQKHTIVWNEERHRGDDTWKTVLSREKKRYNDLMAEGFKLLRSDPEGRYRIADSKGNEIAAIMTKAKADKKGSVILRGDQGGEWKEIERVSSEKFNELIKRCHHLAGLTGRSHRIEDQDGKIIAIASGG